MATDERALQDPASGYASADVLDVNARVNRDHSGEGRAEENRDAMSGYASADVLASRRARGAPRSASHTEPMQDALSGYASADALDPTEAATAR